MFSYKILKSVLRQRHQKKVNTWKFSYLVYENIVILTLLQIFQFYLLYFKGILKGFHIKSPNILLENFIFIFVNILSLLIKDFLIFTNYANKILMFHNISVKTYNKLRKF